MNVSRMTGRARRLRNNATDAEMLLWRGLRGKQMAGHKFRRQYPVAPYIVDFVCLDAKLVVELDGGQHSEQLAYDGRRDAYIRSCGFRVLRYWNDQVMTEMQAVLEDIYRHLMSPSRPPPQVGEE